MKTRLSLALAFLLMVVQGLWAQTPMTPAGENTWTAPMPAYQILLHAEYWDEYVISYELNGGINHEENPVKYYEDQEITLKKPTKEDYIFLGWTGSNGVTPQEFVTIAKGSSGDKNYVANWKLDPEVAKLEILTELYNAIGDDVWTGYGVNTGVISYSRGGAEAFHASFMGGNYAFDLPFAAFTEASKAANTDGSYTYTLTCNLPAQTGMGQETLHVTLKNGEITELESENAGVEMNKEEEISGWVSLQNAFAQGGVIKLAADVADLNSEGALVVPAGKTVVLELGGFTINRNLTEAVENGSVIINNGTLAVMDTLGGKIIGGKTTGNGGGILNNGVLTLYGGEITGNAAAIGGGVYNGGAQGFWMTGGLIKGNTATTHPAIGGEVIFNAQAVVQINADGDKVSIAQALAGLATYSYIKPVMPNYDDLQPADPEALKNELLQELWTALGENVWTGYGVNTGVISYSRGGAEAFHASFMGGNYAFDLPFAAFTEASKAANTDGSYTYTLTCNLPAQTGMGQETLHVTLKNGEITELESENAGVEMQKEEGPVTGWAALQAAMNNGGVIKLADNVVAESEDAALIIPEGKTVVLELEGFTINRGLTAAVENGSVIINNGTLAIMGEGKIIGGNTTGNGGGILNNGIFTLYGGEITGNVAAIGGGVYNNGGAQGFWMTGGLIKENTANSYAAIGGSVIFNENAAVQIDAEGTQVTIEQALANLATYNYIKPVMPSYEDLTPTTFAIALKSDTENADQVVLSTETALEGIVISVTPKEGYEITDFTAYYVVVEEQLGKRYEIAATFHPETGAYSFTMPAADVTIEATIVKKQATAITNTAVDTKATKRIENGQLLIIRDGKTYNVVGTVVR